MKHELSAASGHTVIVRTEPDGSISLLVGRSGVYVLASLTAIEASLIRAALLAAHHAQERD